MIRSGTREHRKKLLPGGSGSGELEDATEALLDVPTVLYPEPTTTTPASASTTGSLWWQIALNMKDNIIVDNFRLSCFPLMLTF